MSVASSHEADAPAPAAATYPVNLSGQFRKNLPLYAGGAVLLLAQQGFLALGELLVDPAIPAGLAGDTARAAPSAALVLAPGIGAALARWLSRVTMFTGGRNVE